MALKLPAIYEVGGCVRDEIIGKPAKDIDFMVCGVSADELLAICSSVGQAEPLMVADQLVGVRLRTEWTDAEGVEIAVARTELSTGAGHLDFEIRPLEVPADLASLEVEQRAGDARFLSHVEQDLARRDFTCNAIARDFSSGQLIDPYGGQQDLAQGALRAVSPDSFRDDPLRILRGLGRVSKDGLEMDQDTERLAIEWAAGVHLDPSLPGALSGERIREELDKILSGSRSAYALQKAAKWGILQRILPEWKASIGFDQSNKHHSLTVDQHQLRVLAQADHLGLKGSLKLAALMHDIGKPATAKAGADGQLHYFAAKQDDPLWQTDKHRAQSHELRGAQLAEQAMDRLHYPKAEIKEVSALIRGHMFGTERGFQARPAARQQLLARKMLALYGFERAQDLTLLRICDLAGKGNEEPAPGFDSDAQSLISVLRDQRSQPTSLKALALNGADLERLGLKPGPETGKVLQSLLKLVVGEPHINKASLLEPHAARFIAAETA